MTRLNPDDYVITRRRKKYKFAAFNNFTNCYESWQWQERDHKLNDTSPILEIGAGSGSFSLELARLHPKKFFIALDSKADRLYSSAKIALEQKLENIVFIRANAEQLLDLFEANFIKQIWLTFSDPMPKKRQIKHRLTHPHFLSIYEQLLQAEGQLLIKHDNNTFFNWSLEQLVARKWHIDEISFDLHNSNLSDDYKILTTYEQRWLGEGRVVSFVKVNRS